MRTVFCSVSLVGVLLGAPAIAGPPLDEGHTRHAEAGVPAPPPPPPLLDAQPGPGGPAKPVVTGNGRTSVLPTYVPSPEARAWEERAGFVGALTGAAVGAGSMALLGVATAPNAAASGMDPTSQAVLFSVAALYLGGAGGALGAVVGSGVGTLIGAAVTQ